MPTNLNPHVAPPPAGFGLAVHLLSEATEDGEFAPAVIPDGIVALSVSGAGEPPMLAEPGTESVVLLERLKQGDKTRLLLLAAAGVELRHNDELAPGLALLEQGDQVAIDGGAPFEFALFSQPYVGVPPSDHPGAKCQLCLKKLSGADTRVWRCGACGQFAHAEEAEDGLQCALVNSSCLSCGEPVRFEPGYLGSPQFMPETGEGQ